MRGQQREGSGLGWQGFDDGELSSLEGEGSGGEEGQGARGRRGAAVAPRWRLSG